MASHTRFLTVPSQLSLIKRHRHELHVDTCPRGGGAKNVDGQTFRISVPDLGKRWKVLIVSDPHWFSRARPPRKPKTQKCRPTNSSDNFRTPLCSSHSMRLRRERLALLHSRNQPTAPQRKEQWDTSRPPTPMSGSGSFTTLACFEGVASTPIATVQQNDAMCRVSRAP